MKTLQFNRQKRRAGIFRIILCIILSSLLDTIPTLIWYALSPHIKFLAFQYCGLHFCQIKSYILISGVK